MRKSGTRKSGLAIVTALATGVILAIAPAHAQDAAPAPAEDAATEEQGVADIVVTAQRRDERVQNVPISITALSGADLERAGVSDVSRLEQVTPGFTFGRSGSDARPSIRGVRTETVNATNDPSIGFYLDGVYQSRAQQALIPLVDIARVEVQRGPQGTLYGRNTFGGNVSVVTNLPTTDRVLGGASIRASNFDTQQYEAYLNLPASDTLAFRFAGARNRSDGFVKSTANPRISLFDRNEWLGRASARWTPTEDLEIVLRAGYWKNSGQGGGAYGYRVSGTLVNTATGQRSINGTPVLYNPTVRDGIADIAGVDVGVPVVGGKYTNNWDYAPFERTHEYLTSAQISYTLGNVLLRSITGWQKFRTDRTADLDQTAVVFPAPGVAAGFAASGYQENDTNAKTFSQEFQVASVATNPLQWIVGFYGLKDKLDERYSQFYTAPAATAADTRGVTKLDITAYAAYAQASYYVLPDTLRVTGGIRYTHEKKEFGIVNYSYPRTGGEVIGTSTSGGPTYNKTIWKAGLDYFVTPRNMLYVSASTGFRSGGINNNTANAAIPESFGPENVMAWEIGSKNRFAGGKVQLNFSAFDYRFKDLQITILNQATNLSYIQNAGKAHSRGFDVTLDLAPSRGLHVNGSATYLEAEFDDYTRPNDFYTATNGDPRLLSFAGKRIPMSPKWKFTGNIYYDAELPDIGTLTPYLSWLHSSSYFTLDYNTVLDRQKPYDKFDARLMWRSTDERFGLEAFVENITNVAVLNRSVLGNSQRIQQSFQPPRTYGVKLSVDF
ncbi:TonB-dependent receptor [Sphingomonas colocasiae]|uniref:TonB-dependent receptor n=1 Tax=Sphingomonas colocasiae TaxID=1848973 RepID=A0ABS7PY58_9SPHN|nr:TonB-dependent receptor [Sphingomonas colocasiae]MBY8826285.1 TonB-dependent receptor [Sphingomonas colocasiae]